MMLKQELVRRAWCEALSQDISTTCGIVLEGKRLTVYFDRVSVKMKSGNEAWYQKMQSS